jgi:hypothetical protein
LREAATIYLVKKSQLIAGFVVFAFLILKKCGEMRDTSRINPSEYSGEYNLCGADGEGVSGKESLSSRGVAEIRGESLNLLGKTNASYCISLCALCDSLRSA